MARPKKADGETVARLGLTLPPELKKEMDEVPEEVNWSAVAAEAFRRKLIELRSSRGGTTMEEVIERMRAVGQIEDNEAFQAGQSNAEFWVKKDATPKQLRRLEKAISQHDGSTEIYVSVMANGMNHGPAVGIHQDIFGDDDCRDFWEGLIGDDWESLANDERYACGFLERAMEMWERVEAKL